MPRPEVSSEENIVRAIHNAWWDIENDVKHSSIFKDSRGNISVSRLSILSLDKLFEIFHQQLDSSPNGKIIAAGEINVGRLVEIGLEHKENPTNLTVEKAPIEENKAKGEVENPAHAEIPQKISKGLANRIIKELIFHKDK